MILFKISSHLTGTIVAIFIHSGRRSIQVLDLKIKDIMKYEGDNGNKYSINFPRAKQRLCGRREQFTEYSITEDLWTVLDLLSKQVVSRVQELLALELNQKVIDNLPLFPNYDAMISKGKIDIKSLEDFLEYDYFHLTTLQCREIIKYVAIKLDVYSERTGVMLNVTSQRFRYTLGTNLAREGKGEHVIAKALDHSDTQNVGIYVQNIPEIVKKIDKAVAFRLASLAQAFQGVLVDSEKDAVRGNDINSRIRNGDKNVGTCGSYGFCHAMAPIACYTCAHFQPWLDGPHESVLEELIKERDHILSETEDIKMASVNDRLILAVSDVVLRCRERKEELERKGLTVG